MAKRNSTPPRRQTISPVCQVRQITVGKHHYDYRAKHVQSQYYSGRSVPWLQLKGDWLEQAGFTIKTPVTVRVMEGCLVLTTKPLIESSS